MCSAGGDFEALTAEALRDLWGEQNAEIETLQAELAVVRGEKDSLINGLRKRLERMEITLAKLAYSTEGNTR